MGLSQFLKKHSLKEGDLIEVAEDGQKLIGNILPSKDKDILVLKLNTGYNTGINVSKIKSVKKMKGEKKVGKAEVKELKKNPSLPAISILHTGGTIASRVDYRSGAVYSSFEPADLLTMFPELGEIANFNSALISNMWSDDLRFKHFEIIAKAVEKEVKKGVEGIIIGMGTDNLAVASAAMAFVLENCPIPVIFTGAQRSSDRGSSDAVMNLVCAAEFIAKSDFSGVAICMHDKSADEKCAILPPCKTRKLHSSRRDAFRAVNDSAIARIDYKTKKIEFLKKDYLKKDKKRKLTVKGKFEDKVGFLKIHIHMFPEEFELYRKGKYKGLVIEGTGLGHTPGHVPNKEAGLHKKFFPILEKLIASGCVVVMTTQTIFGRVHMHVYDKGTDLTGLGIIPGEDMLAETAFVKLAWLLGNYKKKEIEKLVGENLRGEITPCTAIDSFDAKKKKK